MDESVDEDPGEADSARPSWLSRGIGEDFIGHRRQRKSPVGRSAGNSLGKGV